MSLTNGGFEQGVLLPWRDTGNVSLIKSSIGARTGQYYVYMSARRFGTASISQYINLRDVPRPTEGNYELIFFITRLTGFTDGRIVVSFSNYLGAPIIIPYDNIPYENKYFRFAYRIPMNGFRSSLTDLRIEINAGAESMAVRLDDVYFCPC
ncbi:hypothetical protein BKP45_07780 [Anaerobacillus alkalidiazotrophicus]|uniref:NADH:ubiquinone oxidoreductase intermediate-associated protein 30 domain-containing protein n=1 Tax=Anaerobacillus alkalidiazotrophicus TaxID=472963 RepID=A0A1S2M847_9BACI|nr:hypothetical protein [Anaerobacillus alkalidiazotrophicus]OIJ20899.1 hypothetical protein BKP45_07780 [Anaerobacillus alkalidiazotrophicus]